VKHVENQCDLMW